MWFYMYQQTISASVLLGIFNNNRGLDAAMVVADHISHGSLVKNK